MLALALLPAALPVVLLLAVTAPLSFSSSGGDEDELHATIATTARARTASQVRGDTSPLFMRASVGKGRSRCQRDGSSERARRDMLGAWSTPPA